MVFHQFPINEQFVQLSYLKKSCVLTCHILVVANRGKTWPKNIWVFETVFSFFVINNFLFSFFFTNNTT